MARALGGPESRGSSGAEERKKNTKRTIDSQSGNSALVTLARSRETARSNPQPQEESPMNRLSFFPMLVMLAATAACTDDPVALPNPPFTGPDLARFEIVKGTV